MSATPARQYAWMPCRKHGGIGDEAGCQTCQVEKDAPPPGEAGRELSAGDALAAFHGALLALTTSADVKLAVRSMTIRKFNGRAIVFVGLTNGQSVTLRVKLDRVKALRDLLSTVCG